MTERKDLSVPTGLRGGGRPLVALYEPLIPQNTGNIARLCVGFDCDLVLVGQLGFTLTDARVRRAGLDYWPHLFWDVFPDADAFWQGPAANRPVVAFTKKAATLLHQSPIPENPVFLFGGETMGIPEAVMEKHAAARMALPILGKIRSHNLGNSVGMVLFEAHRRGLL